MSMHDYLWIRYADLQLRCCRSPQLDDHSWGLERALDHLLSSIENDSIPQTPQQLDSAIDRAIESGARLHRSRSLGLRTWSQVDEQLTAVSIEAEIEIRRLSEKLRPIDAQMLGAVGLGYSDREIADRVSSTPSAVRTRLSRLRTKLAA